MATKITQLFLLGYLTIGLSTGFAQNQDKAKNNRGGMSKESELWFEENKTSASKKDSIESSSAGSGFEIISINSVKLVDGKKTTGRDLTVEEKPTNGKNSVTMAEGIKGQDFPSYVVTYEITPRTYTECSTPMNTIIFEVPVSEDYYNSVYLKQEVTSWFKTFGGIELRGNFKFQKMNDRWILTIIDKRIVSADEFLEQVNNNTINNSK